MVVGERTHSDQPRTGKLPFELQGVSIVISENKKRFYFIDFLMQEYVDAIEKARNNRERLSHRASSASNLGRAYYPNAVLPWGPSLTEEDDAVRTLKSTLAYTDKFLKSQSPRIRTHPYHSVECGIIEEIQQDLESFRDF